LRFTQGFIQQLKSSISLIDVASENIELRKTGNRYMGRCPFHGDRSPSFSVNKDFYYCFGCKESGDVISFVTKLHGLSFEEACEDLAEKAKIPLPENDKVSSAEEQALYLKRAQIQKGARLNYFASLKYYHANLLQGKEPLHQEAREYLKKRGISEQIIDQFQLGVAGSQSDGLVQFLLKAKAPMEIARQFQLIRASQKTTGDYDFFRERLLFPLIDLRGRVCGFGGRILPSVQKRPSEMKLPKYLNTAESDLFYKSKFLYGLYQAKRAIREEETAILVEGYFDTVAMHQHGIENVVAPCGTSLTEDHLKTLTRLAKRIIVFFDQDEAGINATTKSMEMGLKNGVLLYGIHFESKLDPDEFLLENPIEHLAKLKTWIAGATPLLDSLIEKSFLDSANDIEARTQAIKQAVAWLASYADPVGRAVRVAGLLERWKIPDVALGSLKQSLNSHARPSGAGVRVTPRDSIASTGDPRFTQPEPPLPSGLHPNAPVRRRRPIPIQDRQLLQFLVKFRDFGAQFLEARDQLPEKDTVSELFEDAEIAAWIRELGQNASSLTEIKLDPETVMQASISQELRSVILEGLLEVNGAEDRAQLEGLLKRATHKAWARFSHKLKVRMAEADSAQDAEKLKELSEQFLDLQRKLKEFEDSYVSGKID
jgi:DNA primase